ncbi:hypothetical protein HK098_000097 [Nowakowskiella sp. JEL0407]|nr:hypothetical protein HK098_000097 [Nowakowskiella sp. JEL0407]
MSTILDFLLPGGSSPTVLDICSRTLIFASLYTGLHITSEQIWKNIVLRKRPHIWKAIVEDQTSRIALSEKICSSTNALITAFCGFYVVFIARDFNTLESFYGYAKAENWQITDFFCSAFLGYMLYDLGTMSLQHNNHWTFWFHHIMGFYHSALLLYNRDLAYFALIWSHTELTAVANNILWYQQHLSDPPANPKTSPHYATPNGELILDDDPRPVVAPPSEVLLFARFAALVLFRLWVSPYMVWECITITGGLDKMLKEMFLSGKHSVILSFCSVLDFFIMTFVNTVWTYGGYKAWRRAANKRTAKKKD